MYLLTVRPFDKDIREELAGDWMESSIEGRAKYNEIYTKHRLPDFEDDRSNPILIQVVEEL
jgi:hypothetical protein